VARRRLIHRAFLEKVFTAMPSEQEYKVLSIRQPLAWAVCIGEKTVENRPKTTRHRGLLLIHAGEAADGLRELKESSYWTEYKDLLPLGAIIGCADLYDSVEFDTSLEANPHASGPICYLIRNPKWFQQPIPCTEQMGIGKLPVGLQGRVEEQLNKPGRPVEVREELIKSIRPSPSEVCNRQGLQYLEAEKYDDALRRLGDGIKLDSSNANAIRDLSEAIRVYLNRFKQRDMW
jgi:hypothetical protein